MSRWFSPHIRRQTVPLALATVLGLGCRHDDLVLGAVDATGLERLDAAAAHATDGGGPANVDAATGPDGARVDPGTVPDPAGAGRTAVKFCNHYHNFPMMLEIGPEPIRLTADAGKCAPLLGEPCPTIAGGQVEMVLRPNINYSAGKVKVDLMSDRQYIFSLEEPRDGRLTIEAVVAYLLPAGSSCSAVEALVQQDGGAAGGP
jgi:hypothetical protein